MRILPGAPFLISGPADHRGPQVNTPHVSSCAVPLRTLCLSVRSDEETVANIRSYCPVSAMEWGLAWNGTFNACPVGRGSRLH